MMLPLRESSGIARRPSPASRRKICFAIPSQNLVRLSFQLLHSGPSRKRCIKAQFAESDNTIEAAWKTELGLQSTKLRDDVRDRVEAAVERRNLRATVGEIAAAAGLKLSEADEALKALAYDSQAVLQVVAWRRLCGRALRHACMAASWPLDGECMRSPPLSLSLSSFVGVLGWRRRLQIRA